MCGACAKKNGYSTKREGKGEVVNERGERVRMRWKGQITDKTIKLLTRYYGKAPVSGRQCRMLPGSFF